MSQMHFAHMLGALRDRAAALRGIAALLLTLAVLCVPGFAQAACSSPAGQAGERDYFTTPKNFSFCDDTNWIQFYHQMNLTSCTAAGSLEYDNAMTAYKMCNGTNWKKTGCVDPGACIIANGDLEPISVISLTGSASDMEFFGDYLFVMKRYVGIDAWNIADPGNPALVDSENSAHVGYNNSQSTAISEDGRYMFIPSQDSDRLTVVDISNPASIPTPVASFTHATNLADATTVVVKGTTLFVGGWSGRITSFDISDPATLSMTDMLGTTATGYNLGEFATSGNYVVASAIEDGIVSINVSNPASMALADFVAIVNRRHDYIDVNGNRAIVTSHNLYGGGDNYLAVVDISDPANMAITGNIDSTIGAPLSVATKDDYAFVIDATPSTGRVDVVDVSDMTAPAVVASYAHPNIADPENVRIYRDHLYVSDYANEQIIVFKLGCDQDPTGSGLQQGCPNIGDVCPDGTVYAGLSADNNAPMYAARCDYGMSWNGSSCTGTRGQLGWNNGTITGHVQTNITNASTGKKNSEMIAATDAASDEPGFQDHAAAVYCEDLVANGHSDWYLPAKDELISLRTNRTAIGNFDNSGGYPAGYYWSSTEVDDEDGWDIRFSDGLQDNVYGKDNPLSIRCVRNVAKICDTIGEVCADGTIYAGLTPDGNAPMFVPRCDAGQSWSGVSCTGARLALPWNNNATTGYTTSGVTNANAGAANTTALIGIDSDSGTGGAQPHQAAAHCDSLVAHGHSDWYLPAFNELVHLYDNRADIGGFSSSASPAADQFYWSSTEGSQTGAGARGFGAGGYPDATATKADDFSIRCARKEPVLGPCGGSPALGQTCSDGTKYAGITPDGDVKMYTTPADAGSYTYNNGTTNWYDTGIDNCASGDNSPGDTPGCITGAGNTALLAALTGTGSPHAAAKYCADLVAHGWDDWYMPAQDELNVMYTNRSSIGGFTTTSGSGSSYISSSETWTDTMKWQSFFDGSQGTFNTKDSTGKLRCVRKDPVADACEGSPAIGTICSDGTVFAGYSPDAGKKMFAAPEDSASGTWGSSGTSRATTLNTGAANTALLFGFGAAAHPAASTCANLNKYGHTDWYLPSLDELAVLQTNRWSVGGFTTSGSPASRYYSSSQSSASNAHYRDFNSATTTGNIAKTTSYKVRCVRSEGPPSVLACPDMGGCTTVAEVEYDTVNKVLKYCDGTEWVSFGPPKAVGACDVANPDPGITCADGTVYIGAHPSISGAKIYAADADLSTMLAWSTENVATSATSFVDGIANTDWIIANRNINNYPAMKGCNDLVAHGYDDWYLPSLTELDYVYSYAVVAPGEDSDNPGGNTCEDCGPNDPTGYGGPQAYSFDKTSGGWYWSSTTFDNNNSYDYRFQDGWRDKYGDKDGTTNQVRCIRRVEP